MLTQFQQVHTGWMSASPLWDSATANADLALMQQPALLRFASDNFMEDLQKILQTAPPSLAELLARKESFRVRPSGAPADWSASLPQLKLYQPVHGHFYLVAASLVCRIAGLPDRTIDTANNERAGFVLRRYNPNDGSEMAWVNDPVNGKGWQSVAPRNGDYNYLANSEELLPMFPVNFKMHGHKRRLLVGLIPTSSRETYKAAPNLPPQEPMLAGDDVRLAKDPEGDTRLLELETKFTSQFRELKQMAQDEARPATFPGPALSSAETARRAAAREAQEKDVSRFMLLDLAEFISKNLPGLWNQISAGANLAGKGPEARVIQTLTTHHVEGSGTPTLRDALITALADWDKITLETDSPNPAPVLPYNLKRSDLNEAGLASLVGNLKDLLASQKSTPANKVPFASDLALPKLDTGGTALYRLRCVFQRPNCGPFQADLVSQPTQPFVLAPFFDFDAPARPIRISLPVDTSIAGLRKFNKNVGFMISDQLRGQLERATDLKKALDGNLASGEEFDLGTLCSFSIPIITICAMIVLMIFINLLNFVFWWIPILKICIPIGLLNKLKGS